MYKPNTTKVYSNFTPRSLKYAPYGVTKIVNFGQQMVFREIHEIFTENFFKQPKDVVCQEIKREYSLVLNCDFDVSHIEKLHDLGYLPIHVKSLEEGILIDAKIPILTITNTLPEFFWVTNFLETLISCLLWKPLTSASIAYQFRNLSKVWQQKTDAERSYLVDYQCHNFSMRGMDAPFAVMSSGLGHATSHIGSDSLPDIYAARKYYDETGVVISSVAANEHANFCSLIDYLDNGETSELDGIKYLINKFPKGVLSLIADTFNIWRFCDVYLRELKEDIMKRDGTLTVRGDSGNPVDVMCGTVREFGKGNSPAEKGVIEILWDVFGGTVNNQGYKVLHPSVSTIYGDGVTLQRAEEFFTRLHEKGFASTNIFLGIGSFTYAMLSRDSLGTACKATYIEHDGKPKNLFKNPITDDGMKKSAKGLLKVIKNDNGVYELIDQVSWDEENTGELRTIYKDGEFFNKTTLTEIRNKLK